MRTRPKNPVPVDARALLRLRQVLELVPVSHSSWWAGVKAGKYPAPVKLGPRTTCWRAHDIFRLIDDASAHVGS